MNNSETLSKETQSHDAVIEKFLQELDAARDEDAIASLLAQAVMSHPDRADELGALAAGFKKLRGMRDPERLGQYQIRRVLAVGGMGKLYEAEEDELHRIVVVKTIKFGRVADPHLLDRFDRERRTLARLHHTNIVPIYAAGQEAGLLYFSMPRIHGPSLRTLIKVASTLPTAASAPPSISTFEQLVSEASTEEVKEHASRAATEVEGSLQPEVTEPANGHPVRLNVPRDYYSRVAAMMAEVAEAVHHAHQEGIIHRDLKPANILVENQGHPWVLDFGLAHFRGEAVTSSANPELDGEADPAGPTAGVGTPMYWAPEQVPSSGRPLDLAPPSPIDHRTDVWGLGTTLYELLTLRRAFTSIEQILTEAPHPPSRIVAAFPRELAAICLKALEKNPEDRYPTALALADDLRRWREIRPTVAGEDAILRKTSRLLTLPWVRVRRIGFWSRRKPLAAAVLVLAAVLCAGVVEVNRQRAQAAQRELDLVAVQRDRQPIRAMGWFERVSERIRSLRGGSQGQDPQLQGQAAAALEGVDAVVIKSMEGATEAMAFDASSERLLMVQSGNAEGGHRWSRTTLWERETDRFLVERELGPGVVAFRSDGVPLQVSLGDTTHPNELRLYNVVSGKVQREFRSPLKGDSEVWEFAISRQGTHLAAVAGPNRGDRLLFTPEGKATTIDVWDASTGFQVRTFRHKATEGLSLSPDGRLLAAWDVAGEITVWTVLDGKEHPRFRVGRCPVSCLVFGRDPVWHEDASVPPWLLGVAESSGLVTAWDLVRGRPRSVCHGSAFGVDAMDFSADGALLLTAGRTPTKLWDVATGTCLLDLNVGDYARSVAFSPDGHHCAFSLRIADDRRQPGLNVVGLELGHGIETLHGLGGVVQRTIFSPDGRLVAAASHEWEVGLWERQSGSLIGVLPAPIGLFVDNLGMAFDPTGRRFACSAGHEARLWDIEQRRMIRRWNLPEGLCDSPAFYGDGRLLLIRQENKSRQGGPFEVFPWVKYPRTVRLYDLSSEMPTRPITELDDFNVAVRDIEIADDGSVFAVAGVGSDEGKPRRKFHVYEGPTGRLLRDLRTNRALGFPGSVVFDPTSKVMAAALETAGADEWKTLFDLPGLEYRGISRAPLACLSPDGRRSMGTLGGHPTMIALSEVATEQPLMLMALDDGNPSQPTFSHDGRHVMFGRRDGTVSVLDLAEMNRQLTKLNLGW
jgi:serine/threonine protein kinase/WD40 repeat protein